MYTKHGSLHCINIYLPNGSSNEERQRFKDQWLEDLLTWSKKFIDLDEPVLICGDLNIAHTENDIWNPTGNRNTSGFLLHEREWFTRFLSIGLYDLLRIDSGDIKGPYSWWSNRGQARALNRGWRIDYALANEAAFRIFKSAKILREGGLTVSDHAPLIIDLEL